MSETIRYATWPVLKPGQRPLYKLKNGVVVQNYVAGSSFYTGLALTVNANSGTFRIAAGTVRSRRIIKEASRDAFDRTVQVNTGVAGQYEVRIKRTTAAGGDTVSDACYLGTLTTFSANKRPIIPPKRLAMTALRIRATNQINGSLDGIAGTVSSRQLIWKGGAWVNPTLADTRSNPAGLFRYVLQHPGNAMAVTDAQIDLPQLQHWYEFCTAKGFVYENILTGSRPLRDVLADIAAAGRASVTMVDGKWSVVIDEPKATIAQHFTPHNSWGFEGSRAIPRMPHALRCKFLNRVRDYQPDEMMIYNDGYSASNATLTEAVEFPGVTASTPIFKLGRFHLEQLKLRPEQYTLNADLENLICNRGDRVKVTHHVPMWGLGSGRIKALTLDGNGDVTALTLDEPVPMATGTSYTIRWRRTANNASGTATITGITGNHASVTLTAPITTSKPAVGDLFLFGKLGEEAVDCLVIGIERQNGMQARLTLVDYAPAVFDSEALPFPAWSSQITEPPPLMRLRIGLPPVILSVTTDENALIRQATSLQSNILLKFGPPLAYKNSPALLASVEAQMTTTGSTLWKSMPLVPVKAGAVYLNPVGDGRIYDIRVRYVGRDGRTGPWATQTAVTVIGKTSKPPTITSLTATPRSTSLLLDWAESAHVDVSSYEVRTADEGWGGTGYLYKAWASQCYATPPVAGATANWYVRACDRLGNYSAASATVSYTTATPEAPASISETFADTSLTAATITLDWPDVAPVFGLAHYRVNDTISTRTVLASTITLPASWVGSRVFSVATVDARGNVGTARTKSIDKLAPGSVSNFSASVIDNNVMISWAMPAKTTLPVSHVRLKKGATWATAIDIGNKSGSFTSLFEFQSGTYTYWLAVVDTDGVEGVPVSLAAKVGEPQDYVFHGLMASVSIGV